MYKTERKITIEKNLKVKCFICTHKTHPADLETNILQQLWSRSPQGDAHKHKHAHNEEILWLFVLNTVRYKVCKKVNLCVTPTHVTNLYDRQTQS